MENKEGKLIIFSAPSGSGKTTIVKHLLESMGNLSFSISATSRSPRGQEEHGKDYYFLSIDEFDASVSKDEFLEWEEVYQGSRYGTLRSEVQRLWNEDKHVIFDIDVVGGLNLKKKFGDQALAVFVKAPSMEELEKRLRGRQTDSEEKIMQRVAKAKEETALADQFDHILLNDNLEDAKTKAIDLVSSFLK